jgi:hypothetical protein
VTVTARDGLRTSTHDRNCAFFHALHVLYVNATPNQAPDDVSSDESDRGQQLRGLFRTGPNTPYRKEEEEKSEFFFWLPKSPSSTSA